MKGKNEIVADWLPRYTGTALAEFGKYILLVNFSNYVRMFAEWHQVPVRGEGRPMLNATANAALIEACRNVGLLDGRQAGLLAEAHAVLLHRALACTLDLRSRIAPRDAELERLSVQVRDVSRELGFDF